MFERPLFRLAVTICALSTSACDAIGPRFEVKGGKVDAACSGIFEYCSRARCTVKNLGSSAAPATVTFKLHQPDGTIVSADEYVMLNPKEPKEVRHDFREARLVDEGATTVECAAAAAK